MCLGGSDRRTPDRRAGPRRAVRRLVTILRREAAAGYPQHYCTLRMPVVRPGWRYPALADRTWVLMTEAPEGGRGLGGHANTNAELASGASCAVVGVLAPGDPEFGIGPVQV
jgi:hypothetical protein